MRYWNGKPSNRRVFVIYGCVRDTTGDNNGPPFTDLRALPEHVRRFIEHDVGVLLEGD